MHTQSTFRGEPQLSNQRNTTGRRPRITGIDAARAIAIIGMAYAHLGPIFFSSDIDTVASLLTTGFASALFAVLAGVSVSIMSQRGVEKGGVELAQSRQQLMLRGTILIGIGLVLSIAQYNIAVVLSAVGALFLVLPLVARWSNRALWALLVGLLALGPFVIVASDTFNTYVDIISGSYPLTAWFTYGVAGMLVHRYLIHSRMLQWISLVAGVVLAVIGVNARSWISDQLPAPEDPKMYDQLTTDPTPAAGVAGGGPGGATNSNPDIQSTWWYTYLGPEPHMGGLIDIATSITVSVAVIALCLLITALPLGRTILYPLRAMGSMSLTVYVAHVLTAAMILTNDNNNPAWSSSEEPATHPLALGVTIVVAIVCAMIWKQFFRRGPLEWVMHVLTVKGARVDMEGVERTR